MSTGQIQIRISISEQLAELLKSKANRLGVPVTQFVKHLLIKEAEEEQYPTYVMSDRSEKKLEKALQESDKTKGVGNVHDFFTNLRKTK
jgi:antitoxin component of RelBE/YafQ-DinJ toxin-antitoxin module